MIMREPVFRPEPRNSFQALGRKALHFLREAGRCGVLFGQALWAGRYLFVSKRMRHDLVAQMYVAGIRSIPVITIVAVFTGMILALQTGLALTRYKD